MKKCKRCQESFDLSKFTKNKAEKDGLCIYCVTCCAIKRKSYRENNKEKISARSKEKYQENREENIARSKKYEEEHKEERKAYRQKPEVQAARKEREKRYYEIPENKEKRTEYIKEYYETYYAENRETILLKAKEKGATPEHKEKRAIYDKMRNIRDKEKIAIQQKTYRETHPEEIKRMKRDHYHNVDKHDPEYKIMMNLRSRLWNIIKSNNKGHMDELICCDREFLIKHIESLWTNGMNWQNHGAGKNKWQIDHIIACDYFDLTKKIEQEQCFHYSNLQPMWGEDNARKGNKIMVPVPSESQKNQILPFDWL